MKKIISIAVLALVSLAAFAQTSRDIYNKYSDKRNVSAVYISPAMFKLIKAIPDMHVNGDDVNLASAIKSLEGLYVLNTSDQSIASSIHNEAEKLVKSGKYELLLEAKESGETTRIYTVTKGDYVTDLVLLAGEGSGSTFVAITGSIKSDELAKILND